MENQEYRLVHARVFVYAESYVSLYERQINYMPSGDVNPNETDRRTCIVDDFSSDFIKRVPTQSEQLTWVHRGICA